MMTGIWNNAAMESTGGFFTRALYSFHSALGPSPCDICCCVVVDYRTPEREVLGLIPTSTLSSSLTKTLYYFNNFPYSNAEATKVDLAVK